MKNFLLRLIVCDGVLRDWVHWFLTVVTLCFMGLPWLFDIPFALKWVFFVFGAILGAVDVFAERAKIFGLRPFTNDPLGWRKAKATYTDHTETKLNMSEHKEN